MKSRRLFALIAVLAVAWGSLWPLVSAAQPKSPAISVVVCTQSGFQQHIEIPGDDRGPKFHCPLCVLAVDGALAEIPAAHAWIPVDVAQPVERVAAVFRPGFSARPPPSRAPPALL